MLTIVANHLHTNAWLEYSSEEKKLKSILRLQIFQFIHLFFDIFFFERGIETARGNPSGIDFSSVQCMDFKIAHVPKFRFKIPADSTIIYTLVIFSYTVPQWKKCQNDFIFHRVKTNLIPFEAYCRMNGKKLGLNSLPLCDKNRNHASGTIHRIAIETDSVLQKCRKYPWKMVFNCVSLFISCRTFALLQLHIGLHAHRHWVCRMLFQYNICIHFWFIQNSFGCIHANHIDRLLTFLWQLSASWIESCFAGNSSKTAF